jgi:hypothetical protein
VSTSAAIGRLMTTSWLAFHAKIHPEFPKLQSAGVSC